MKHSVSDTSTRGKVETTAIDNLIACVHDVTQDGEQQFASAADHFAIDECAPGGAPKRNFQSLVLLYEADLEVPEAVQHFARIIAVAAGIQDRQHAATQQCIESTLAAGSQLIDLELRQDLKASLWPDFSVNEFGVS